MHYMTAVSLEIHLDVVGHVELTLDRGFSGGRCLELFDIARERVLHSVERVTQLGDLVVALERGQGGVEVSLGHLLGRVGKDA